MEKTTVLHTRTHIVTHAHTQKQNPRAHTHTRPHTRARTKLLQSLGSAVTRCHKLNNYPLTGRHCRTHSYHVHADIKWLTHIYNGQDTQLMWKQQHSRPRHLPSVSTACIYELVVCGQSYLYVCMCARVCVCVCVHDVHLAICVTFL